MAKAYGAFNSDQPDYPNRITYVIDAEGKIEHAFEKVDPRTESQTLLEKLRSGDP